MVGANRARAKARAKARVSGKRETSESEKVARIFGTGSAGLPESKAAPFHAPISYLTNTVKLSNRAAHLVAVDLESKKYRSPSLCRLQFTVPRCEALQLTLLVYKRVFEAVYEQQQFDAMWSLDKVFCSDYMRRCIPWIAPSLRGRLRAEQDAFRNSITTALFPPTLHQLQLLLDSPFDAVET